MQLKFIFLFLLISTMISCGRKANHQNAAITEQESLSADSEEDDTTGLGGDTSANTFALYISPIMDVTSDHPENNSLGLSLASKSAPPPRKVKNLAGDSIEVNSSELATVIPGQYAQPVGKKKELVRFIGGAGKGAVPLPSGGKTPAHFRASQSATFKKQVTKVDDEVKEIDRRLKKTSARNERVQLVDMKTKLLERRKVMLRIAKLTDNQGEFFTTKEDFDSAMGTFFVDGKFPQEIQGQKISNYSKAAKIPDISQRDEGGFVQVIYSPNEVPVSRTSKRLLAGVNNLQPEEKQAALDRLAGVGIYSDHLPGQAHTGSASEYIVPPGNSLNGRKIGRYIRTPTGGYRLHSVVQALDKGDFKVIEVGPVANKTTKLDQVLSREDADKWSATTQ